MAISALAYISYLSYPNYQCAKHTAVIYALKEMFSSHHDLTLAVGRLTSSITHMTMMKTIQWILLNWFRII